MDRARSLSTPFFAGLALAFGLCALNPSSSLPSAQAQARAPAPGLSVTTNQGTQAQGKDLVFLVDSTEGSRRLAIYEYKGDRLELGAVRDIDYDLRFTEWAKKGNAQVPPVKAQRKQVEEEEQEREKTERRPR